MQQSTLDDPPTCQETGLFVMKDYCYTLLRQDGTQFWLELDRIPMDLVDRPVRIRGSLYDKNLICVDMIAPA
ncbi:MAG: DUF5818 domain-containing protein [Sphingobium sp.]